MRCLIVLFLLCVTNLSYSQVKKRSKPINYGHATYDMLPKVSLKEVKIDWFYRSEYLLDPKELNIIIYCNKSKNPCAYVEAAFEEFYNKNWTKYTIKIDNTNRNYNVINHEFDMCSMTIAYSLIKP